MLNLRAARPAIHLAVGCLILALVLRTWLVMGLIEPVTVAGSSMAPTLRDGDRLQVDRTAFQHRQPSRWELVCALNPTDATELCVKRVVGLPGDAIALRGAEVFVNGARVVKLADWGFELRPLSASNIWRGRSWQLGPDEYFLLGDNPPVSLDSRLWGPVSARLLIGKPLIGMTSTGDR